MIYRHECCSYCVCYVLQEELEIFLKVYDLDVSDDVDSHSDELDTFIIHPNITLTNTAFSSSVMYSGSNDVASIELAYRLSCSEGYYGTDCSLYCVDTNDETGHYSCNSTTGSKVCLDGYQNTLANCTECIQLAPNCS